MDIPPTFAFMLPFAHRHSISVCSRVPVAQYNKITEPFGNRYLYTLIQLKRFLLCPFHSIHIYTDHVNRKYTLRHDGFPFGSICSPWRLIMSILCTRYNENILFKYNQGMPAFVQTMFLFLFNVI